MLLSQELEQGVWVTTGRYFSPNLLMAFSETCSSFLKSDNVQFIANVHVGDRNALFSFGCYPDILGSFSIFIMWDQFLDCFFIFLSVFWDHSADDPSKEAPAKAIKKRVLPNHFIQSPRGFAFRQESQLIPR